MRGVVGPCLSKFLKGHRKSRIHVALGSLRDLFVASFPHARCSFLRFLWCGAVRHYRSGTVRKLGGVVPNRVGAPTSRSFVVAKCRLRARLSHFSLILQQLPNARRRLTALTSSQKAAGPLARRRSRLGRL